MGTVSDMQRSQSVHSGLLQFLFARCFLTVVLSVQTPADAQPVQCWGYHYTVGGHEGDDFRNVPASLTEDMEVHSLVAGSSHACAIAGYKKQLQCWGYNLQNETSVPADLGAVHEVAVGRRFTCAIVVGGSLRCWGDIHLEESSLFGAHEHVAAGGRYVAAVSTGGLRAWKDGQEVSLPRYMRKQERHLRQLVVGTMPAKQSAFLCTLSTWGTVRCAELPHNSDEMNVPEDLGRAVRIAAGAYYACALTREGMARCWGYYKPHFIPDFLGQAAALVAGKDHACTRDSHSWSCWGPENEHKVYVPSGIGIIAELVPGGTYTCAILGKWSNEKVEVDIAPRVPKPTISTSVDVFGSPENLAVLAYSTALFGALLVVAAGSFAAAIRKSSTFQRFENDLECMDWKSLHEFHNFFGVKTHGWVLAPASRRLQHLFRQALRRLSMDIVAPPRCGDILLHSGSRMSAALPTGLQVQGCRSSVGRGLRHLSSSWLLKCHASMPNCWEAEDGAWLTPLSANQLLLWLPGTSRIPARLQRLHAQQTLGDWLLICIPVLLLLALTAVSQWTWLPLASAPLVTFLVVTRCLAPRLRGTAARPFLACAQLLKFAADALLQSAALYWTLDRSSQEGAHAIHSWLAALAALAVLVSATEALNAIRALLARRQRALLQKQKVPFLWRAVAWAHVCNCTVLFLSSLMLGRSLLDSEVGTLLSLTILPLMGEKLFGSGSLLEDLNWPSDTEALGHALQEADWERLAAELQMVGHVQPDGEFLEGLCGRFGVLQELKPYIATMSIHDMLCFFDCPSRFASIHCDCVTGITALGLDRFSRTRGSRCRKLLAGSASTLTFQVRSTVCPMAFPKEQGPVSILEVLKKHVNHAGRPEYTSRNFANKEDLNNTLAVVSQYDLAEVQEGHGLFDEDEKDPKFQLQVSVTPRPGPNSIPWDTDSVIRVQRSLELLILDALGDTFVKGATQLFLLGKILDLFSPDPIDAGTSLHPPESMVGLPQSAWRQPTPAAASRPASASIQTAPYQPPQMLTASAGK